MPFYEYKCSKCKNEFEVFSRSVSEEKHRDTVCPECGSRKVEKKISSFSSAVSTSQGRDAPPPSCSGGCCSCGL